MFYFCTFPLSGKNLYNLEICSCNICHGLTLFLWQSLQNSFFSLSSGGENLIQEFNLFSVGLCRWISVVVEKEGNTPDLLPLLQHKILTFQKTALGYLDLLFYPTENFRSLDQTFVVMQSSLAERIKALEQKIVLLLHKVPSSEIETHLRQLVFWSQQDYVLTFQSLWGSLSSGHTKVSHAIL